jgi:hypothetical protein
MKEFENLSIEQLDELHAALGKCVDILNPEELKLTELCMKVKDIVNNVELELNRDELIQKMKDGRQVDLILKERKTDEVGYLTWDMEQWSTVDGKRYIRTYQLDGRVLSEYTSHNIHDLKAYFMPDDASGVQLS